MCRLHADAINHSCSAHIKGIIYLGKNTHILTYFIMGINVRNNYAINNAVVEVYDY